MTVNQLDVRHRRFATNFLRQRAMRTPWPSAWRLLRLLYGIRAEELPRPDLIIGCGRPTAAAGILLRQWFGARFLYCGNLRDYDPALVDLMLVHTPLHATAPSKIITPIPSKIDPYALPSPRRAAGPAETTGLSVGLFLGGKGAGYLYDQAEWVRIADLVKDTASRYGLKWRVAGSRRTPDAASDLFACLAEQGVLDFVDFRSAGPGSATRLFASDIIVTTEDSLSMMSEGIAARRPVIAFRPKNVGSRAPAAIIAHMIESGGLAVLPVSEVSPGVFIETLLALDPPRHDSRRMIGAALLPMIAEIRAKMESESRYSQDGPARPESLSR